MFENGTPWWFHAVNLGCFFALTYYAWTGQKFSLVILVIVLLLWYFNCHLAESSARRWREVAEKAIDTLYRCKDELEKRSIYIDKI